jgi:hypothetical protein
LAANSCSVASARDGLSSKSTFPCFVDTISSEISSPAITATF